MRRRLFIWDSLKTIGGSLLQRIQEPLGRGWRWPHYGEDEEELANNTFIASDNFASGSFAAGWSTFPGFVQPVITGSPKVTEPGALSTSVGVIWTGNTFLSDQVSEITLGTITSDAATYAFPCVRVQSAANNSYYAAVLATAGTLTLARYDSGVQTVLKTVSLLTVATGDVWALQAYGSALVVYRNGSFIAFATDATYTGGFPGYNQFSGTNVTFTQVASWRGYNAVQQDGVWQKQGCVLVPTASDLSPAAGFNAGTWVASRILREGNAQLLSGTVYKVWFNGGSNIYYAESLNAKVWTRKSTAILTSHSFPQIFKSGNTYYLYVQGNPGTTAFAAYTSTDGINFSLQNATALSPGAGGTWDAVIYSFNVVYIDSGGTWHAIYTGVQVATPAYAIGVATSPDGLNWTKYGGNPVASSMFATPPLLIGGTWYMWGGGSQAGLESGANFFDPQETVRSSTVDLINWTGKINSLHHTQLIEGVNGANGAAGFSYGDGVIQVGGSTYLFHDVGPGDITGGIWQVSLSIAPAPPSSLITTREDGTVPVASSTFTSGNGALPSQWTTPTGGTALQIVSGPLVEPTATSTICQAIYTGASFGPSQYSEATLQNLSGAAGASFLQLVVFGSTSSVTQYEGSVSGALNSQSGNCQIFRRVSGVATQLGPNINSTPKVGDVWRVSVFIGGDGFPVITLFQNGFSVIQVQDTSSSALTSGSPGIQLYSTVAVTGAQINSWAGGNTNVIPAYSVGSTFEFGGDNRHCSSGLSPGAPLAS